MLNFRIFSRKKQGNFCYFKFRQRVPFELDLESLSHIFHFFVISLSFSCSHIYILVRYSATYSFSALLIISFVSENMLTLICSTFKAFKRESNFNTVIHLLTFSFLISLYFCICIIQ
jgi:hypothetical protein